MCSFVVPCPVEGNLFHGPAHVTGPGRQRFRPRPNPPHVSPPSPLSVWPDEPGQVESKFSYVSPTLHSLLVRLTNSHNTFANIVLLVSVSRSHHDDRKTSRTTAHGASAQSCAPRPRSRVHAPRTGSIWRDRAAPCAPFPPRARSWCSRHVPNPRGDYERLR